MTSSFRRGGIAASIVLIALGVGAIVIGFAGRDTAPTDLARGADRRHARLERSPARRSTPAARRRSLPPSCASTRSRPLVARPTRSWAASWTSRVRRSSDEKAAATDPKSGKPVENPLRNMWVTETALTTALNTAYFAESVTMFVIAMGGALLLVGIGFLVLTVRLLKPEARRGSHRADRHDRRRRRLISMSDSVLVVRCDSTPTPARRHEA